MPVVSSGSSTHSPGQSAGRGRLESPTTLSPSAAQARATAVARVECPAPWWWT